MFFQGNNAEDGGGPRASLERLTPQQIGLLALICVFVLIAIVTVVAFLIWACVVLFETYPSISEVCNSEAPVWLFCIICLTVMVLSLATGAAKDMDGNLTYYSYIFLCLSIALTIWGLAMWVGMGPECQAVYEGKYESLMLLFKMDLVLLCIQGALMICLVLCGALAIGWMMTQYESGRAAVTGEQAADPGAQAENGGYQQVPENAR